METYVIKNKQFYINDFGCYEIFGIKGKPTVRDREKVVSAARFIFEQCFGEVPEGFLVRHKCDNAFCINPEHLGLGTQKESMNDLYLKKRLKDRSHLLTIKEALKAKHLIEDKGLSMTEAAAEMGFPYSSLFRSLYNLQFGLDIPEDDVKMAKHLLESEGYSLQGISELFEVPLELLKKKVNEPEEMQAMTSQERQRAFEMFRAGQTYPEIAEALNKPLNAVFSAVKDFF